MTNIKKLGKPVVLCHPTDCFSRQSPLILTICLAMKRPNVTAWMRFRAVRAETPEHALLAVALRDDESGVAEDVAVRDVVDNADHEAVHRLLGRHVRVDVRAHLRSEVLRADAVASGEDLRARRELRDAVLLRLAESRDGVEVERIADGARLLNAVEDSDAFQKKRS